MKTLTRQERTFHTFYPLLYAVKAQMSLAPLSWFHGSRVPNAHVHQCCRFSELCEDCAVANEIDYEIDDAWTNIHGIHDNGPRDHGVWRLTLTAYYCASVLYVRTQWWQNLDGRIHLTRIVAKISFFVPARPRKIKTSCYELEKFKRNIIVESIFTSRISHTIYIQSPCSFFGTYCSIEKWITISTIWITMMWVHDEIKIIGPDRRQQNRAEP